MGLMEKLKKNSKMTFTSVLEESQFFNEKEKIPTVIPALNIALSGEVDGGLSSGILQIAGQSKHFKTSFALYMTSAYLKKYPEAVCLFYDSEFGSPKEYFQNFDIDTSKVLHTPVTNVEELKFDIMNQLENIERGEKVIILIDSIGNLASKKEVDDALNEKSVADMSRAKQLKSLFRMITPHLTLKNLPLIAINHTYSDMGCLEGGTEIKTLRGLVKIKDLKVGDVVLTIKGSQRVNYCFPPEEIPTDGKKYLKITLENGEEIKCTDNHRFFMSDRSWVEAGNLKIGDEFY